MRPPRPASASTAFLTSASSAHSSSSASPRTTGARALGARPRCVTWCGERRQAGPEVRRVPVRQVGEVHAGRGAAAGRCARSAAPPARAARSRPPGVRRSAHASGRPAPAAGRSTRRASVSGVPSWCADSRAIAANTRARSAAQRERGWRGTRPRRRRASASSSSSEDGAEVAPPSAARRCAPCRRPARRRGGVGAVERRRRSRAIAGESSAIGRGQVRRVGHARRARPSPRAGCRAPGSRGRARGALRSRPPRAGRRGRRRRGRRAPTRGARRR